MSIPFSSLLSGTLLTLVCFLPVSAQNQQGMDLSVLDEMDAQELRELCGVLYQRIETLQQEISDLKQQLAHARSGSTAAESAIDTTSTTVDEGIWLITVQEISDASEAIAQLQERIKEQEQLLNGDGSSTTKTVTTYGSSEGFDSRSSRQVQSGLRAELAAAREDHARRAAATTREWNTRTQSYESKPRFSPRELSPFLATIRELERRERTAMVQITRLRNEAEQLQRSRSITAVAEDGKVLTVLAQGVHANLVNQMEVGGQYRIRGGGHFVGNQGTVRMRAVERVE